MTAHLKLVSMAVLLAAACGPNLEARQSKERMAQLSWESALGVCREAQRLASNGGAPTPVTAEACADAEGRRVAYLAACQAARGDGRACELAAQSIERRP